MNKLILDENHEDTTLSDIIKRLQDIENESFGVLQVENMEITIHIPNTIYHNGKCIKIVTHNQPEEV